MQLPTTTAKYDSAAGCPAVPGRPRGSGLDSANQERHADIFAQQQQSAYAFSSFNNSVYRFGIDRYRETVGKPNSQMCAGCHDVTLLIDGAMRQEVAPDDPRAHAGITCRTCHAIEHATVDGNGSYTLAAKTLTSPDDDPESIRVHREQAAPLDDDTMCAACHRSFLSPETGNDHFLSGMDHVRASRGSAHHKSGAGRIDDPVPQTTCRDCHMPDVPATLGDAAAREDGNVASHRFLGGHTWLANTLGSEEQLREQTRFLQGSVSVDVPVAFDDQGRAHRPTLPLRPGGSFAFDVVVRNLRVSHVFTGGVGDAVDSWRRSTSVMQGAAASR